MIHGMPFTSLRRLLVTIAVTAVWPASITAQTTWVVDAANGAGANFTDIVVRQLVESWWGNLGSQVGPEGYRDALLA